MIKNPTERKTKRARNLQTLMDNRERFKERSEERLAEMDRGIARLKKEIGKGD